MLKEQIKVLDEDIWYDFEESREKAADRVGCSIIYPHDNQLQVDIDSESDYARYVSAVKNLPDTLIVHEQITISKSGEPHRHITLTLSRPFSSLERIALQYMLGSDYIRESLSILRVLNGVDNPICFFEREQK